MFGSNFKASAMYWEGIDSFRRDTVVKIVLNKSEGKVVFTSCDKQIVNLPFEKITNVALIRGKDIKNASTLGRSVVGGVLFGSLGATVGAISSTKKKDVPLLVINYIDNNETIQAISMYNVPTRVDILPLNNKLKKLIVIKPLPEINL